MYNDSIRPAAVKVLLTINVFVEDKVVSRLVRGTMSTNPLAISLGIEMSRVRSETHQDSRIL